MFNNVTKTPQFASALIGCDTISRDQNCTPAVSKWLPHAAEIAAFRSWQHDTYADGRYRKAWNMIQTPIMQPMWKIVTFIDVGWAEQRKVSGACGGQISLPVLAQQMVVGFPPLTRVPMQASIHLHVDSIQCWFQRSNQSAAMGSEHGSHNHGDQSLITLEDSPLMNQSPLPIPHIIAYANQTTFHVQTGRG